MNICHLPDNILEKIFSDIDYYEVPNLTLVCKRFNDVIGSSSQLMKNLVIFWKKNITKKADLKLLLSSNRKYQIISIKEVVGIEQNLQNVYTKYANSLTEVQFFDCSFKSSELSATLKILQENLREIGMCKVNFEIDSIMKPIGFKKLEDMNMMYFSSNGFCKIFNLFIDCKSLKSLRCEDDCEISFEEAEIFSNFLSSCVSLKSLILFKSFTQKIFLNEKFNNAAKFQLNKLSIYMNLPPHRSEMNAEEVAYENLFKFIMKQSSTLKNINIGTSKITVDQMEILLKLNLLDLGFQSCEFIYDREISIENFSIQSLFISMEGCEENEQVLCDLIASCKKLKETRFVWAVLKFEVCFSIRKSGIEKLSMFHGQIFPMTIPSLKILDVDGLMAQIETIKFIRLNPQLKELHVPGSFQNFEMFSQAVDELENLEILYLS